MLLLWIIVGLWAFILLRIHLAGRMRMACIDMVHMHNLCCIDSGNFGRTVDYDTLLPHYTHTTFDLTLWTIDDGLRRYADPKIWEKLA